MELHEVEKQLILYTKGHFKQVNYQEDLKYFAAKLYNLPPKHVELYSIVNMVIDLYQELIDNGYLKFNFKTFMNDIFKRAYREQNKREVNWNIIIREMLAEIQGMQVNNLTDKEDLELGEVNLSLIPEKIKIKF